jgi:hypothetical protein
MKRRIRMANATIPPWAYEGTDLTPEVKLYPFTTANSLPALIVWLILATNSDDAANLVSSPAAITEIATAVNLTETCVKSILSKYAQDVVPNGVDTPVGTAAEVGKAFQLVIASFHEISNNPATYPPPDCPHYIDVLKLANGLQDFTPSAGG